MVTEFDLTEHTSTSEQAYAKQKDITRWTPSFRRMSTLPRRLLKLRAKNRLNLLLDTDRYSHTTGLKMYRA